MNPWLHVPLDDYEGHMQLASVAQLSALSDLFREALARVQPGSAAVLGIAGGNGLEHIDPAVTTRVVGLDVNPGYLDATRTRHAGLPGLELHQVDLAAAAVDVVGLAPVDLVHAAMVFEHAGLGLCLDNALALCAPGGCLSVVLQLPSASDAAVAPSPFTSMASLKDHFSLVDPQEFATLMAERGLVLTHTSTRALPSGKAFWSGFFTRA